MFPRQSDQGDYEYLHLDSFWPNPTTLLLIVWIHSTAMVVAVGATQNGRTPDAALRMRGVATRRDAYNPKLIPDNHNLGTWDV
ncbi:hypothetical protein PtrM4_019370 [Pyrenophora tritici-repentis]|uniref:Uncharacterized protein n=1 Tax=Pyrenophora tritici-repentis TaxID=45151 RepID=A0A834SDZ2_9PLEO|nr:hypothetical protein PtrM4_019370 [Pyrenophora tritici-repentis]KAI1513626.1 hypothetical protein Ptr86124_007528 [Pyrenophora tritici-repentis]KAI1674252.1 hypothetical protein L13192_00999 [Pyrenophora tritici-repentis]